MISLALTRRAANSPSLAIPDTEQRRISRSPDHLQRIRQSGCRLPDWPAIRGARLIRRLGAGPTSDSYLIALGGLHYALRVDRRAALRLGLNRSGELAMLRLVRRKGFGPMPVAADVRRGLLLLAYLPGHALTNRSLQASSVGRKLGGLLARLHQLVPVSGVGSLPRLDLLEAAARYRDLARSREADRYAVEISCLLRGLDTTTRVPTHNDLHAGNIVVNPSGALKLIDWEYAALGPPGFDMAVFLSQTCMNPAAREGFFSAYEAAGGQSMRETLPRWLKVAGLIDRLWNMAAESHKVSPQRRLVSN